MANTGSNRVELPIEISPSDSRDIKQLLERIDQAEKKLYKLQEAEVSLPSLGGSPTDISPQSEASHRGHSRNPRSNEVDLPEMEAEESSGGEEILYGALSSQQFSRGAVNPPTHQFGNIPKTGKVARGGLYAGVSPVNKINQLTARVNRLELISGGLGTLSSIAKSPIGWLSGIISQAAPIIGPILIAKGLMDLIISELIRPGGPFDRRFEIKIQNQVNRLANRKTLAEIRAGIVDIRVSSNVTLRGSRGNVASSLSFYKSGRPLYSETLERYAKGITQ